MASKVVVLLGSPRKNGNSAALADEIARAAQSAGAEVDSFFLHEMNIAPCCACEGCHKPDSSGCVIDDDMSRVYAALRAADAFIIATPIYWFTVSAQIKTSLDRCYALVGGANGLTPFAGKRVALAMAYGGEDPLSSGAVNAVRTFQDAFRFTGADIAGMVYGRASEPGEIASNARLLEQARELGKTLVS